jgi:23S rRNA pseudouridine1911/1915/1917 synthase
MALTVLYCDPCCLVVEKPAGLATLQATNSTIADLATLMAPARPVHRLDNATSGCVLLAQTQASYDALREQFQSRTVEKDYFALVEDLTPTEGTMTTAIGHHATQADRMVLATPGHPLRGRAQHAETHFTTTRHFFPTAQGDTPLSLVEVTIATGVRHQIRVHLASIGHPVIGDAIYGREASTPYDRHLLHAARLAFHSPHTGERISVTSPLPEDFHTIARALGVRL